MVVFRLYHGSVLDDSRDAWRGEDRVVYDGWDKGVRAGQ